MPFLQICIEFFCEAIKAGIPLRGCISTGMATMNQHDSIYFGRPLVEAARGEAAQSCIGMAVGRSFNNYHPVYNRYFIPYLGHIKEYGKGVFSFYCKTHCAFILRLLASNCDPLRWARSWCAAMRAAFPVIETISVLPFLSATKDLSPDVLRFFMPKEQKSALHHNSQYMYPNVPQRGKFLPI